jgi:hypothetical protein
VIQLLLILGLATVLFAFLLVLAWKGRAEGGGEVLVEARQALVTLETELLSHRLVDRIFAKDDLEFVVSEQSPAMIRLFMKERKRIALLWVERVGDQIRFLRQLHLGSARYYARLDFKTEVLLAWDFTILLVTCQALHVVFFVGGAYVAPGMVGNVAAVAGRVCDVSRQSLAFLTKPGFDHLGGASAGGPPALGA